MSYDGQTPSVAYTAKGQLQIGDSNNRPSILTPAGANQILLADASGVVGWGNLLNVRAGLASDVTMTTANTFYDGPLFTGLSAHPRLYMGAVVVQLDGGADHITARLWNGTTVVADAEDTGASGDVLTLFLVGVSSATSLKISVAGTVGGHTLKAICPHNATLATASYLLYLGIGN